MDTRALIVETAREAALRASASGSARDRRVASPQPRFALVVGVAGLLAAGCGGGGGGGRGGATSAPVTSGTTGATSSSGAFVVDVSPAQAPAATTAELLLAFSEPVDAQSVVLGRALVVVQDTDTNPGGTFADLPGSVSARSATVLAFTPARAFTVDREVRLELTRDVRAASGAALERGPGSSALSFAAQAPGAVHEHRFRPTAAATTPATPAAPATPATTTTPGAPPGVRPSVFVPQAGTDVWHIDFDLRAADLATDFERRGLRSGDAATDALLRDLFVGQALSWTGQKYLRTPRGEAVAGQSWAASFTATSPGGQPGRAHSREGVGGRHATSASILGVSIFDPGNNGREDNAAAGRGGIFPRSINGLRSTLDPALTAADKKYLDGSYRLGQGTAAEDARMNQVLGVVADWSHAVGSVIAHEVGHSVGLNHDESDAKGLMRAATNGGLLSDPTSRFSAASAAVLDQNLGRQ